MTSEKSGETMEIPLLFPSLEASPRRFVVNDTARSIREYRSESAVVSSSPGKEDTTTRFYYYDMDQGEVLWRGAASISSLRGGIGARDAVLATSFLPDKPEILSVSLLPARETEDIPPALVQLDLGSETSQFGTPVKVKAFYWNQIGHPTSIALILVDTNAVVLRIRLDVATLCPQDIGIWNVGEMVATKVRSQLSPSYLHASMVVPLSATSLLMGLNPFLLAVDLQHNDAVLWSKSKCLEDMRSRSSSLGNILAKGVDLFIGKLEHSQFVDMQPVAALCVGFALCDAVGLPR